MTSKTSTGHDQIKRTAASKLVLRNPTAWEQSQKRRKAFIDLIRSGASIDEACAGVGVGRSAYKNWRLNDKAFAAMVDVARVGEGALERVWDGTHASFAKEFLDWDYAWHQMRAVESYESCPLGDIVITLWPPDHGKTATYENFASEKLAREPETARLTVTSESLTISKKILGKVRLRCEPDGPFPNYVRRWGPFKPPGGQSRAKTVAQPWSDQHFNVFKKRHSDERDYSMQALGFKSSIVSTRCTHLHMDDLQSTKTNQPKTSERVAQYVRQDCLTRTGEHGINTWACTRVAIDDAVGQIMDDDELAPLVHVIRFPAVKTDNTDPNNPVQIPLWPERYNLDQLDRMRKKAGPDIWDLSYMHMAGVAERNRTFDQETIDIAVSPLYSMLTSPDPDSIVYLNLDPALGGRNVVLALELEPKRVVVRWTREDVGFRQNEQIMGALKAVIDRMRMAGARVTDVVIEEMNFQKGLKNDDRLSALARSYGFNVRGHLSGWNKYSEDIGIPSMASSMRAGEIVLPYADDGVSQFQTDEMVRQLKSWKPGLRGSKVRMDYLMALWFGWILWQERFKAIPDTNTDSWQRQGLPWAPTQTGLLVPTGR